MKEVLQGGGDNNKYSSKRVVTFILTITLIAVVIANTFFGFEIQNFVYEGLVNVLIWSLGFVGSEQFAGALKQRYGQKNTSRPTPRHPDYEDKEEF